MPQIPDSPDDRSSGSRLSLWQRLTLLVLKPDVPDEAGAPDRGRRAVDEVSVELKSATDKERLIGLIAAPIAAAIAILVVGALIANDPAALLANGAVNKSHVNPSLYHELLGVLLALSVGMVLTAFLRKRLYLGILASLYGLALFNMHYWGFGVPFLMVGAWLLVRCYRLQREYNDVTGTPSAAARRAAARQPAKASGPTASKRYTPPGRAGGRRR
jgi:hypothetical protein